MNDIVWRAYETVDFDEAKILWLADVARAAEFPGPGAKPSLLCGKPAVLKGNPLIDSQASAIAEVIHAYPRGIVHAVRYRYSERDGMNEWLMQFWKADERFGAAQSAAWEAIRRQERITCRRCGSVVVMAHHRAGGDCPVCLEEYGLFPEDAIPDRDTFEAEAEAVAGPKPPLVEKIGWVIGGRLQSNPERTQHAENTDPVRA